MEETLIQQVDRYNTEITNLELSLEFFKKVDQYDMQVANLIEIQIDVRKNWIDVNYKRAIHAMVFDLLHSFRTKEVYVRTNRRDQVILNELENLSMIHLKSHSNMEYILQVPFNDLPSVEYFTNLYFQLRKEEIS